MASRRQRATRERSPARRRLVTLALLLGPASACSESSATTRTSSSGQVTGGDATPPTTEAEPATTGSDAATTTTTTSHDEPPGDAATTDAKFDVGAQPDVASPPGCPGDGPDLVYSHIWVANSPGGTVTKIDTRTREQLARYFTAPSHAGNPSRTSVNRAGDVAVVNRAGGVVAFAGRRARCVDRDGDGQITTAQPGAPPLPWPDDECLLWHTPLPPDSRPVAWTPGEIVEGPTPDEDGCELELVGAMLWSSAPVGSDIHVYLLDGESGDIVDAAVIPDRASVFGIYGAAVNSAGDFWGVVYPEGPLVRVAFADLAHEVIELELPSAYGFTVDGYGRPWVGGFDGALQRLHPPSHTWATVDTGLNSLLRGMTEGPGGALWIATLAPAGLLKVDTGSLEVLTHLGDEALPGVDTPTGASVDGEGKIWLVDQNAAGGGAFVYDPATAAVEFIGGLEAPYTYSDMTGWALGNVAAPG